MNKLLLTSALTSIALLGSLDAHAMTTYANKTIKEIAVGEAYHGEVVIRLADHGSLTGRPGCATNSHWTLSFDGTTEPGKQAYSMALLAASSNAVVTVAGESSCNGNIEELRWIRLK